MVTFDRRKLAAPVFAQAAAFVVVLAIGGFTGSSKTPAPAPTHQASPVAAATSSATSPAATAGHRAKLTVKVVEEGTNGLSLSGSQVKVLQSTTLDTVATGTLSTALEFAANLPAGTYQVCVKPPGAWASATAGTHVLNGFICGRADAGPGPSSVTLRLTPQVPGQ